MTGSASETARSLINDLDRTGTPGWALKPNELFPKEVILNIAVCIKQVPDSAAKVMADGGKVTWGDAPLVMNPWDEYAVEAALVQAEAAGGEVTAISVGGESAKEALKTALAMGCSQAILISDPALESADSRTIARVLSAAIQKVGEISLAVFGKQAIDGDMGVTGAQTARCLGWPLVSMAVSVETQGGRLKIERAVEEGRQSVETSLPAVITISKDFGEPRYPSFMGIRKASRAVIPTWSLGDLGMQAPEPAVRWPEVTNPPAREVKTEIITGGSPQEIAEKLADKILEEKVL